MNPEEEIIRLKQEVASLKERLDEKDRRQLRFPIDVVSRNVLQENLPVFVSTTSSSPTTNGYISVKINNRSFNLMTTA